LTDEPDGRRGSGIDRRTLIKGAAAAGVAAWTAPVIIDSLTSPAAAQTVPQGCWRAWVLFPSCSTWLSAGPAGIISCTPEAGCTETNSATNVGTAVTLSSCPPAHESQTAVTATVNGGIDCRIVAASATTRNDTDGDAQCSARTTTGTTNDVTFTFAANLKSVIIDPVGNNAWDNDGTNRSAIGIVIQCP
jgi:hypothetical protein